jgi:hypothetical protein
MNVLNIVAGFIFGLLIGKAIIDAADYLTHRKDTHQ